MSILARGRAAAESRMTSRATIRRKTGDVDGVGQWSTVHTNLPFRLVPRGNSVVTVGGVEFSAATARGDMPWNTTDLADGDLIDVTAGEWAGEVVRVLEAVKGDQQTARRVPVVAASRPEEWS